MKLDEHQLVRLSDFFPENRELQNYPRGERWREKSGGGRAAWIWWPTVLIRNMLNDIIRFRDIASPSTSHTRQIDDGRGE